MRKVPGGTAGGPTYLAGGKWGARDVSFGRRRLLSGRVPEYKVCSDVRYVCVKSLDASGACVAVKTKTKPGTSALSRLCPWCKGR